MERPVLHQSKGHAASLKACYFVWEEGPILTDKIRALGREAEFVDADATDDVMRQQIIEQLGQIFAASGTLRVLLHALDPRWLPPLSGAEQVASKQQLESAASITGHSVVYWAQDCLRAGLFEGGGRILALTSARTRPGRALVETYIRQLAVELAPAGITANSIIAGIADTPALRHTPDYEEALKSARQRNPHRRLTVPDDVARYIAALCHPATYWLTGNTLHVDGGENIVG